MRLAAWENEEEEPGCFTCWCANKISIIDSIFNFEGTEVFACPSGHTRCLKCSYLAKNGPTMYRDMLGKSYLSVPMIKPKSQKCSNGHALQHFLINVQANWQYNCLFCRKLFLFSN